MQNIFTSGNKMILRLINIGVPTSIILMATAGTLSQNDITVDVARILGSILASTIILTLLSLIIGAIPFFILRNRIADASKLIFGTLIIIFGVSFTLFFAFTNSPKDYTSSVGNLPISSIKKNATDKRAEYSKVDGQKYTNSKYNLSITFPEGWKVENGSMPSSLQRASSDDGSSMIVLVEDFRLGDLRLSSIKDIGNLDMFGEATMKTMISQFPDAKVHNSGETTLSGEPAFWYELTYTYHGSDSNAKLKQLVYCLAKDHYLYTISSTAGADIFDELKPMFIKSVETFKLEGF